MRISVFIVLLFSVVCCGGEDDPTNTPDPDPVFKDMIRGTDISFLPEIESAGAQFYNEAGAEAAMLDILKSSGVNTIRIRLWHTPVNTHSSLAEVKTFSDRVKAKGFNVWITVHYSDTWADPGHQAKPEAWEDVSSVTVLADSVYKYTKKITALLNPDIIQIGNEINGGFLWPEGKTDSEHLPDFITLLKKGSQAVREVSPDTKIMVHIAGFDIATWFYQQLNTNNVDYDMIGLSYYPVWHGKDLGVLQSTINTLGATHAKEIVIAETAYPFSFGYNDFTNNIIGSTNQILPAYAATEEGQQKFLMKLKSILNEAPQGAGFCYWGAEWIAFKGSTATDGSSWENQALFDFDNKAVPALNAFAGEE
jgi:arabinogalactan endo-1,4-beta-galactosidase